MPLPIFQGRDLEKRLVFCFVFFFNCLEEFLSLILSGACEHLKMNCTVKFHDVKIQFRWESRAPIAPLGLQRWTGRAHRCPWC